MKHKMVMAVLTVAVLIGGSATAASAADLVVNNDAKIIDGVVVDAPVETSAQLEAYLASSISKTVVMDVDTGALVEVHAGQVSEIQLRTTVNNPCNASLQNLCLKPIGAPYAAYGFDGAGTLDGTWNNRGSWTTGKWHAQLSWLSGSNFVTGVGLAPNTGAYFGNAPAGGVTVLKVKLATGTISA